MENSIAYDADRMSQTHVARSEIRRGWLRGIEEDGTLLVAPDQSSRTIYRCDMLLQLGGVSTVLGPGERVIFVPPDDANPRGCVLGTIGRYTVSSAVIPEGLNPPAASNPETRERILNLAADEKISIACGEASITLQADGAVMLRGVKIVTRATGQNRIKGASVQIN